MKRLRSLWLKRTLSELAEKVSVLVISRKLNPSINCCVHVGTPRRKKKIVHQTAATDDKKLQSTLKKLAVNSIPGIEEVNMYVFASKI